jgi:hypothetical protein
MGVRYALRMWETSCNMGIPKQDHKRQTVCFAKAIPNCSTLAEQPNSNTPTANKSKSKSRQTEANKGKSGAEIGKAVQKQTKAKDSGTGYHI